MHKHYEATDTQVETQANVEQEARENESVLIAPYRAFGLYCSTVPAVLYKSGEDTLIASVVGKHAFYVYNVERLNLVFMSRFIAEEITGLQAVTSGLIYTSLLESNRIVSWNKMHRVKEYSGHTQQIIKFLVTDSIIFSLAEGGEFIIFNTKTCGKISTHMFTPAFDVMMHPVTYVNKLLFGCSSSEHLELWNIIESDKIYAFESLKGCGGVQCIE